VLVVPPEADRAYAEAAAAASSFARDLINTPANDMGPAELAAAAMDLAGRFQARASVIVGDELKARELPSDPRRRCGQSPTSTAHRFALGR